MVAAFAGGGRASGRSRRRRELRKRVWARLRRAVFCPPLGLALPGFTNDVLRRSQVFVLGQPNEYTVEVQSDSDSNACGKDFSSQFGPGPMSFSKMEGDVTDCDSNACGEDISSQFGPGPMSFGRMEGVATDYDSDARGDDILSQFVPGVVSFGKMDGDASYHGSDARGKRKSVVDLVYDLAVDAAEAGCTLGTPVIVDRLAEEAERSIALWVQLGVMGARGNAIRWVLAEDGSKRFIQMCEHKGKYEEDVAANDEDEKEKKWRLRCVGKKGLHRG